MEGSRFDHLTRSLARGASRRSVLKGLLGLGGAALTGSVLLDGDTDAARRPSNPTPTPVRCPGKQVLSGGQCVCPGGLAKCGPDCCNPAAVGALHSECCDNACCFGTCYGEELCCPTSRTFCNERECCEEGQPCCTVDDCCTGTCYDDRQFCCAAGSGEICGDDCCDIAAEQCCEGTNGPVCIDRATQCCVDDDCPDSPEHCGVGVCTAQFTCTFESVCAPGEDCCKGGDNTCCAEPNACCGAECCAPETPCCGDTCCDPAQCNEIDDVCCPDGTARCGTGEDACCADGLMCCLEGGKTCGECCNDQDCVDVVDFPNCMRSRCDFVSRTCVLYDVCEEEGRVCCPGVEVGFCYSPDQGQCCTNDDCPGCDVCTRGDSGSVCHGSCLPVFLDCCEAGDDPNQWFCYNPANPDACPAA